jgi:hypothetical protein
MTGGKLPGKIGVILALLIVSRVGTYIPISGRVLPQYRVKPEFEAVSPWQ